MNNAKRRANAAAPGGAAMPAMNYKNRERGTGSGKAIAGTAAGEPAPAKERPMNVQGDPPEFSPFGQGIFGQPVEATDAKGGALAEKFLFPPFSVLNAREGPWQERKRAWLSLGIKSEVGRGEVTTWGNAPSGDSTVSDAAYTDAAKSKRRVPLLSGGQGNSKEQAAALAERYGLDEAGLADGGQGVYQSATSIFDPVLCELCYRWFCPPGGQIIDPFAGGSVRGIVAAKLGYRYWGCDLRQEQIDANAKQACEICPDAGDRLQWVCGDSMHVLEADGTPAQADLAFTCPPYGDLERYSDDPRDLSTMEYHTFFPSWKRIMFRTAGVLKQHAFVVVVVGDFRDGRMGYYRGFVADTIVGFRELGLWLYNEAILVTAVGSLPIRVGAQFGASRKLGRTHQSVLVFAKGDPEIAAAACARGD